MVAGRNQFASDVAVEAFLFIKTLKIVFKLYFTWGFRLLIIVLSHNPHKSAFNPLL